MHLIGFMLIIYTGEAFNKGPGWLPAYQVVSI